MQIDIVSHKTVFAHHDPLKTNLRSSALEFLRDSRVFDVGAISFKTFTSRALDDKVAKIQALGCEIFIDDLNIVFEHYDFQKHAAKFYLTVFKNHMAYVDGDRFLMISLDNNLIANCWVGQLKKKYTFLRPINVGINSWVFKVKLETNM